MNSSLARPGAKAQAGIGTLIILIAAILVATIAAGVFFDVAGLLEGQTASTSEDVSRQLDGRLEVVAAAGTVSGDSIDTVNVTVKLASDGGTIDLRDVTIQWVRSAGVETLVWNGSDDGGATFEITTYGDSDPVLDDSRDRATLTIQPESFGPPLQAGDVVTLTIITRAEVVYRLRVPDPLDRESSVSL